MTLSEVELVRTLEKAAPGPFQGRVWRVHWREVTGDDWSFSVRTSGRYHRGLDLFPPGQAFAVLYTSLAPEIAIWEMVRRSAARNLAYSKNNALTEIQVDLHRVLDISHPSTIGLSQNDLIGTNLRPGQQIGATARSLSLEALLVPSAALPGHNLVLFPDNLPRPGSLRVGRSTELPLDAIVEQYGENEPAHDS